MPRGCGCGGAGSTAPVIIPESGAQEYTFTDQSGQEVLRGTEMQARAALYRADGAGKVEPS
jgi:hypothetical protein